MLRKPEASLGGMTQKEPTVLGGDTMSGLVEEHRHELLRLAAEESIQDANLGHGVVCSSSVSTVSEQASRIHAL